MSDYNYKDVYEQWVNNPLFGQETKDELLAIKDDEKEIEERFYCDLVFGTAGLRGGAYRLSLKLRIAYLDRYDCCQTLSQIIT